MPRYKTISRWYNRESGEYVDPPTEVELDEVKGAPLVRAGCLVLVADAPKPVGGKVEPTKPWPPPPNSTTKLPTRSRKPKDA